MRDQVHHNAERNRPQCGQDLLSRPQLERGDYWIVVQSRYQDEPNLIRCRRRIKVV